MKSAKIIVLWVLGILFVSFSFIKLSLNDANLWSQVYFSGHAVLGGILILSGVVISVSEDIIEKLDELKKDISIIVPKSIEKNCTRIITSFDVGLKEVNCNDIMSTIEDNKNDVVINDNKWYCPQCGSLHSGQEIQCECGAARPNFSVY